jgi:hypothetical protein
MSHRRYSRKWKNFRKHYSRRYVERCYSGDGLCSRCARHWLYCECPEKRTGEIEIAMEWRLIAHHPTDGNKETHESSPIHRR